MEGNGSSKGLILLVDDDQNVIDVVERYLHREGFDVISETSGPSALDLARSSKPDLVVLDLMLPGMDGLELCRTLRDTSSVPIVMLTAKGDEQDRVLGLELGADDYVSKPFSPRELMLRIDAILRRARGEYRADQQDGVVTLGRVSLDLKARTASVEGGAVALTPLEFDLLAQLVRNAGRVFTRDELLQSVWGFTFGDTSTVTVHIRRLREKIESDPSSPKHLVTVWGVGYRFDP